MTWETWKGLHQRRSFFLLFIICTALVVVQYRFNYFSVDRCRNNERYVKRVVERVYYEIPRSTIHPVVPTSKPRKQTAEFRYRNIGEHITKQTNGGEDQLCQPQKYILFLKTHKTGSSTITNILNRYADKYNMSILLPKGSTYYSFDWPNKFRLSFSAQTFRRPNFLANHARYSRKSMNVLFPRDRTMYISVLRHPVSQWESTFQYMSLPYILDITQKTDPLDFFLNNPPTLQNILEISRRYPSLYLIRNPLFFDLGLDHRHFDNATFIRRALKTLDNDFDLILIMEHFDESLTLLRRRLCWGIDDVVYFKMNERLSKHKRQVLSERHIHKIKTWNNADMALYNFFVEKFWNQVKNEGPGFYDDVMELKERRKYYSNLCIERQAIEEAYSSVFVKGYKMRANITGDTKLFCERMLKNELRYMDYFRTKRAKWLGSIEGVNIQNFENSADEVDMFVETSDIKASNYKYGRLKVTKMPPTKSSLIKNATRTILKNKNTSNKGRLLKENKKKKKKKKIDITYKVIDELLDTPVIVKTDGELEQIIREKLPKDETKYDGKSIVKPASREAFS